MKVCGLTGGVGMGKSTAAGFFLAEGVRIVDTDEIARELVRSGQPALGKIKEAFGDGMLLTSGELDRAGLARLVFTSASARQKLEAILHPRIRENWLARLETWRREKCPLAIVVIPLLFETAAESHFEKILCVACSPSAQHQRLTDRSWSDEQIQHRIAAQWPTEQKIARANFVIWTEGNKEVHQRQVAKIVPML